MRNRLLCNALTLVLTLLFARPGWSQNGFTWTPTMSLVDNTPNCATINCLTGIGSGYFLQAGSDGTIYGLKGAVLYTYAPGGAGWVEAPAALQAAGGDSLTYISVANASNVLALSSASARNVFVLNATGTEWTRVGTATLTSAEIGPDGSIWGLNSVGRILTWGGTVWTSPPGYLSALANAGGGAVFGVTSAGVLEEWNGTAFAAFSPAPPFTLSTSVNSLAVMEPYISALDSAGGIHISEQAGAAGTWNTISGNASDITGAGPFTFVTILSGGGGIPPHPIEILNDHINMVAPQLSVSASGAKACPFVENIESINCNSSETHTLNATAVFGGLGGLHGTAGVTVSNVVPMTGADVQSAGPAVETGSLCDPFFGNPAAPECTPGDMGDDICSVAGSLANGGDAPVGTWSTGVAATGMKFNGQVFGGTGLVECGVNYYCTPATTPPVCPGPLYVYTGTAWKSASQAGSVCATQATWLVKSPWLSITVLGVTNVICASPNYGQAFGNQPPWSCTTPADVGAALDKAAAKDKVAELDKQLK